ncbi:MAG TPA: bifunctional 2-C-methyl-D-erythritol 4-phosphate cytidylyltransferase/2-C-methyl-D-erythritol 2,4-cyclodiphosphate synthase [Hyphomicrobiaceae bacterium]|nr:bifunctional 2-C-methyl-D-erythritol 4-phosphate cytidylyltransferase/2-C-methyl-D-erythritol 2,4-cyclodiphosphate synthase [Hyphomicrobiaceae bacterium]
MTIAAIILAGGQGTRAGPVPKQYQPIGGVPLLRRTVAAFLAEPRVEQVAVVCPRVDAARVAAILAGLDRDSRLMAPVTGGATRQASGLAGLEALAASVLPPETVLIHDAARPFVTRALLDRIIGGLDRHPAVIPGLAVADTLKIVDAIGRITGTQPRDKLWRAQTPQAFRFAEILVAHRKAATAGRHDFTDDAALAEWAGLPVGIVEGSEANRKLTTAEDLAMADDMLSREGEVRIGQGFDVHAFKPGDHVWLCGVRIPHACALEGHSDADVGLHALTDALLGAIGDGDIGQHFPPSDERWRGAASDQFLADAARRVRERGGVVVNVDVTLLAEAPRIAPHREAMRARVGQILGIGADRVSVKATTTEKLGFVGRKEGLAALAIATVRLP